MKKLENCILLMERLRFILEAIHIILANSDYKEEKLKTLIREMEILINKLKENNCYKLEILNDFEYLLKIFKHRFEIKRVQDAKITSLSYEDILKKTKSIMAQL